MMPPSNENGMPHLRAEIDNGAILPVKKQASPSAGRAMWRFVINFRHALKPKQMRRHLTMSNLRRLAPRAGLVALLGFGFGAAVHTGWISFSTNAPMYADAEAPTAPNPYARAASYTEPEPNLEQSGLGESPQADWQAIAAELEAVPESVQVAYLRRFGRVAREEMQRFKVPASVLLGLAVLHSRFGTDAAAQESNTHLALGCAEGACARFESAWAGFRAGSVQLTSGAYEELRNIARSDVQAWIAGLERLGYQSPSFSAEALRWVIETYQLERLDKK